MLSLKQVKSNYGVENGRVNKAVVGLNFLIVWILDTINMVLLFFQFELKIAVHAAFMKKNICEVNNFWCIFKKNFIFDVFARRVSFPLKYGKAIFWRSRSL